MAASAEPDRSTTESQPFKEQQWQHQDPNWAPLPRAHTQYDRANRSGAKKEKEGDKDEGEEEDEYEKRIKRTGCSTENEALQLCYAEKHDWRACKDAMNAFRECWKRNGNVQAEV
ncbi:hypothetical protein BX616_005855 [Lobosporangium transversale]|uniref:CHCH domain-containing protein n=1 Tax=Lobosporangium transversale TaxID=64571 RepID=A0A1Y2GLS7_9FUNG|nr:hypothetical protein BCR41DRAFT_354237 [Lobosporangium transversale]KAF9915567.1 hypothetical protein BX616_005855 [Lobosporangium transversale]ORZ14872.1 hypothetical protein BCR41DRAFT_354237 [Lobosporangium transversale]|eukprot:XP_021881004.1 hypothetical protein BCR41DRAFT_354237 [Lobosporangium transversale]